MPMPSTFRALCLKCMKVHTLWRGDVILGVMFIDGRFVAPEWACPICGSLCLNAKPEPYVVIFLNMVLALVDFFSRIRKMFKRL